MDEVIDAAPDLTDAVLHGVVTNSTDTSVNSFPTLVVFWSTCMQHSAGEFLTGAICGLVSATIATAISIHHLRKLQACKFSKRREHAMTVNRLAPAYALACTLGVSIPRGSMLWLEVMHVFEAYIVYCFGELMFLLIFEHDAQEARVALSRAPTDGSFYHTKAQDGYLAVVARLLSRQEPRRLLASPPLLCCLTPLARWCPNSVGRLPCAQLMRADLTMLRGIRHALRAFVFGLPALAIFRLWSREAWDRPALVVTVVEQICGGLELIFTLGALYALVVLYRACHGLISHHRITAKFFAVKVLIVVNNVQKLFIRLLVGHETLPNFCLTPPAHAAWLQYVLLLLELPLLAALHAWAYPVKELLHVCDDHAADQRRGGAHAYRPSVRARISASVRRAPPPAATPERVSEEEADEAREDDAAEHLQMGHDGEQSQPGAPPSSQGGERESAAAAAAKGPTEVGEAKGGRLLPAGGVVSDAV